MQKKESEACVDPIHFVVFFFQTFQWPVARPIDKDEVVEIQLFNYNKYLSNR